MEIKCFEKSFSLIYFRAALGGAVCAPYCKNLPFLPYQVQLENAEDLLEARKNYICPEICALQLGKLLSKFFYKIEITKSANQQILKSKKLNQLIL